MRLNLLQPNSLACTYQHANASQTVPVQSCAYAVMCLADRYMTVFPDQYAREESQDLCLRGYLSESLWLSEAAQSAEIHNIAVHNLLVHNGSLLESLPYIASEFL